MNDITPGQQAPEIRIACVTRAETCSPNSVDKDAAIFGAVVSRLRAMGFRAETYAEERFAGEDIDADVVLNMCRLEESVRKLKRLEQSGRLVINSGHGIANCSRRRMTRLLIDGGVPCPDSIIIGTDADALPVAGTLTGPCWIKRGDFQSTQKEDVAYCRDRAEVSEALRGYRLRGIGSAVVSRHLEGDLVKFYGVASTGFFHWFYPYEAGHSKYGCEAVNGRPRGYGFDEEALRDICRRAADILGVLVYGGDCIVGADGSVALIDFNDWPSFSPCREEGSAAIAECVARAINEWKKK